MNNPIKNADQQMAEVEGHLVDRIRHLELHGNVVERDAMMLYRAKIASARLALSPILKGLEYAERQGGPTQAPVNQPGGGGTAVGVRPERVEDDAETVQTEDQGDQGKDG